MPSDRRRSGGRTLLLAALLAIWIAVLVAVWWPAPAVERSAAPAAPTPREVASATRAPASAAAVQAPPPGTR